MTDHPSGCRVTQDTTSTLLSSPVRLKAVADLRTKISAMVVLIVKYWEA